MNPASLIKFLPELATAILVALIAGKLSLAWHRQTVLEDKNHERAAVTAQITADAHQCIMDKQLTENVENEYQAQIADLTRRYNAERVSRPRKCVVPAPTARAAERFNAAEQSTPRPVAVGITSDALLDYQRACRTIEAQLRGLQEFDRQVWKANGQ